MTRTIVVKVVGVTYPEPRTGESRQSILAALKGNEPTRIVPEPENPYDNNALAIHIATAPGVVKHIGFIPRELAAIIALHLEGEAVMSRILEITGGFETRYGDVALLGLRIEVEIPDSPALMHRDDNIDRKYYGVDEFPNDYDLPDGDTSGKD